MTHLDLENQTSDYLEGLLTPAQKSDVEAHLSACPSCLEMVEDVRRVVQRCHSASEMEPAPWLVSKIMLATVGERQPTLADRLVAFLRPAFQPRLAYGVAMAVFSFSIIVNAAGINLRHMTIEDLNPRTWFFRANRAGHLYYARAEKFYYDLRVVYEIESRLRQLHSQPGGEEEAPKQEPPAGGSTDSAPQVMPALASNHVRVVDAADFAAILRHDSAPNLPTSEAVRSQNP